MSSHDPHDEDEGGVYIGLGWGERLTIPLMIAGVVSVPILSIPFIETAYDLVRVFVLVQAFMVIFVQTATVFGSLARGLRSKDQPEVVRSLRWAYTGRVAASTILSAVMTYGVAGRIGYEGIDWRTPTLQLCLLLLALSWGFMDRRILWLERRVDTPEFLRIIEQFGALRAIREDREEDERRRVRRQT